MRILLFAISMLVMTQNPVLAEEWELIWSDEFDYLGLPDKTKWDYEEGFVRNKESQYYTRARLENARVETGMLILECRKEHFTPGKHAPVEYTAASLITLNKASWQYGRIEVRAKLPRGKAFGLPSGCSERIFHGSVGQPAGRLMSWSLSGRSPIISTARCITPWMANTNRTVARSKQRSRLMTSTFMPSSGVRIELISFSTARKFHTVSIDKAGKGEDNPFRKPCYLLINFALGGSWGGPIDETVLPQTFLIDYVRIYRETSGQHNTPADAENLRR